ncbi:MAG: NAD(P)H-binding protein [Pseudomonadota bacterium]
MDILVIGGSRGIGLATVKAGLAAGHSMRAFARSAGKIDISDEAFTAIEGDALDTDALTAAAKGADAVIQTIGLPVNRETVFSPVDFAARATVAMITAMEGAGVRRVLAVTGFGAGRSREAMSSLERLGHGAVLGRIYDDKSNQEKLIMESGLDWTVVRPVILTNGKAKGRYAVLMTPDEWRNGLISRADVAEFLLKAVDDPTYIGADPVLSSALAR